MGILVDFVGLVVELFWLWVLIETFQEDDPTWRWVVMFGNFPAAVAYLIVRKLPRQEVAFPDAVRRWMLRRKIADARSAARHIGGAYQYSALGRLLQSVNDLREAHDAYQKALAKDPADAQALWGVAMIELKRGQPKAARAALEALLRASPDHQSGEARLAYVRLLLKSDELPAAEEALEVYLKKWNEPEARYYMARLLMERRELARALALLEDIIDDVRAGAPAEFDRNCRWMTAAEKLLPHLKGGRRSAGAEVSDGRLG